MKEFEVLEDLMYKGEHEILNQGFNALSLVLKLTENNYVELLNDLNNAR